MTRAFLLAALSLVALGAPASAQQAQQQQQQPATPSGPPPVDQMSVQDLRAAVTRLRGYVNRGATRPPSATTFPGCTSPESRQMDFWVGDWVLAPTGSPEAIVGHNTITLHDQGCVIIETWRPFSGASGMSINIYDPVTQHWHQTFVGALGRRTTYEGSMQDGVMRMDVTSPPPAPPPAPQGQQRMNFQRIDDNSLRQWGERLDPATNQWVITFDLTYQRRAGSAPQRQQ